MDQQSVGTLVDELEAAYKAGLDWYQRWKREKGRTNHYRRQSTSALVTSTNCALSASLKISGERIRTTYDVGHDFIGPDFLVGDDVCRQCLSGQLTSLTELVRTLAEATRVENSRPLELHHLIQASESARGGAVSALGEQYKRLAAGRAVPPDLLAAMRQTPRSSTESPLARPEFDSRTAVWSTTSPASRFQSEPPSPPSTPPPELDGWPDNLQGDAVTPLPPSLSASQPRRPRNGVFSIFCPEALALQLDGMRGAPERGRCKCGFRWKLPEVPEASVAIQLKEGFRMSRRFLAKSHCEQAEAAGEEHGSESAPGGYGCLFCTSSGHTDTYGTAEALRLHINAAHSKWQMLHDRDIT